MNEQLITFRTAKLAKEKGLSIATTYYYDFSGSVGSSNRINKINWNKSLDSIYSAPTQSLLAKWLREEHGINVNIKHKPWSQAYSFTITGKYQEGDGGVLQNFTFRNFDTYEEALEEGLYQALLLIEDKSNTVK